MLKRRKFVFLNKKWSRLALRSFTKLYPPFCFYYRCSEVYRYRSSCFFALYWPLPGKKFLFCLFVARHGCLIRHSRTIQVSQHESYPVKIKMAPPKKKKRLSKADWKKLRKKEERNRRKLGDLEQVVAKNLLFLRSGGNWFLQMADASALSLKALERPFIKHKKRLRKLWSKEIWRSAWMTAHLQKSRFRKMSQASGNVSRLMTKKECRSSAKLPHLMTPKQIALSGDFSCASPHNSWI